MNSNKRGKILPIVMILLLIVSAVVFIPHLISDKPAQNPDDSEPTVISMSDILSDSDFLLPPEEPKLPDTATLMFGGDVLIHKTVYNQAYIGDSKYDFTPYVEFFRNVFVADYNAVNLECPVDAYGGNSNISSYPRFNAPLELLDAIEHMGVDLCSNSNNHMIDQGYEGLEATLQNVREKGFDTLGTYTSQEEHDTLFIKDINGIRIGFVAYTQFTNGLSLSSELEAYAFDRMGIKKSAVDDIIPKVNELRAAGAEIVIAILHWGTEYNDFPSNAQIAIAEGLCAGGVDVIIGSHPHVVQPIKKITAAAEDGTERECLVVYSLGNLMCNQATLSELTQQGMVVSLKFVRGDDGKVRLEDSFYMPTLLYVSWEPGADYMRLVPAAQYLNNENIPDILNRKGFIARAEETWNRVRRIVGDDIQAVASPEQYPEGFFSEPNNIQ